MTQSKSNGNSNGNSNRHGATNEKVEISTDPISPNSKKVYVNGTLHPDIKVPFREISLSPSTTISGNGDGNGNGHHKENDESSILVYDTSGPYTDPETKIDIREGLQPIRLPWITGREDVEYYDARTILPKDDGYRDGENPNTERFPKTRSQVHARNQGKMSPKCITPKGESLPPRWSSSPFVKTRNANNGSKMLNGKID